MRLLLTTALAMSLMAGYCTANDRVSTRLSVGMWDSDGRIHNELVAQAEAAGDNGESFDYVPPSLYLLVEGEDPDERVPRKVQIALDSIGASFQYSGPRDLVFYLEIPNPEGDSQPEIAGRITLPEEGANYLLLFVPEPDLDTPYRILPINVSGTNFPRGQIQMFNLSSKELLLSIDGASERLNPRSQQVVSPGDKEEPFRVRFAAWDENQDRWRIIFSRFQPALNDARRLCMIVNDPNRPGGVSIRFIRVPG